MIFLLPNVVRSFYRDMRLNFHVSILKEKIHANIFYILDFSLNQKISLLVFYYYISCIFQEQSYFHKHLYCNIS